MKDKILKIAKCKTEKQFYAKYPSEEAFMKAHGKEFKKAQMGIAMSKPTIPSYNDLLNQTQLNVTGTNNKIQQEQAYKQQMLTAQQQPKQSGGFDFGKAIGQFGEIAGKMGQAQEGEKVPYDESGQYYNNQSTSPTAQTQDYTSENDQWAASTIQSTTPNNSAQKRNSLLGNIGKAIGNFDKSGKISKQVGKFAKPAGDIIGGIQAFGNEQDALKTSRQTLALANLSREAQDSGVQASARDAASMRIKHFLHPE